MTDLAGFRAGSLMDAVPEMLTVTAVVGIGLWMAIRWSKNHDK